MASRNRYQQNTAGFRAVKGSKGAKIEKRNKRGKISLKKQIDVFLSKLKADYEAKVSLKQDIMPSSIAAKTNWKGVFNVNTENK